MSYGLPPVWAATRYDCNDRGHPAQHRRCPAWGKFPGFKKVKLHNLFLALNGDDFLRTFHDAAEGKIENFILVVEGPFPNKHSDEGYWASVGADPKVSRSPRVNGSIVSPPCLGSGFGGNLCHLRWDSFAPCTLI
jgi:hypothetical protein